MKRYRLVGGALLLAALLLAAAGCEMYSYYGKLGGADKTVSAEIEKILAPKVGVWYSHYGTKRLDGYTIGKWKDLKTLLGEEKIALFERLFPDFDFDNPRFKPLQGEDAAEDAEEAVVGDEDYFVFYDDTVYNQGEDGSGEGEGDWGFGYMGIARAVNTFQDSENGAIIIEYLDGCYPKWSDTIIDTPLPFFGIYYRVLAPDSIQMANAVVLANLFAGQPYHTETATLAEALAKNNAENDGEFISWGVVIPQDREPIK
jgi:hypothetical protein